jgi:hypothetical protein
MGEIIFDDVSFSGGPSFGRTYRCATSEGLPFGPPMSHTIDGVDVDRERWERELVQWRAWWAERYPA